MNNFFFLKKLYDLDGFLFYFYKKKVNQSGLWNLPQINFPSKRISDTPLPRIRIRKMKRTYGIDVL